MTRDDATAKTSDAITGTVATVVAAAAVYNGWRRLLHLVYICNRHTHMILIGIRESFKTRLSKCYASNFASYS